MFEDYEEIDAYGERKFDRKEFSEVEELVGNYLEKAKFLKIIYIVTFLLGAFIPIIAIILIFFLEIIIFGNERVLKKKVEEYFDKFYRKELQEFKNSENIEKNNHKLYKDFFGNKIFKGSKKEKDFFNFEYLDLEKKLMLGKILLVGTAILGKILFNFLTRF